MDEMTPRQELRHFLKRAAETRAQLLAACIAATPADLAGIRRLAIETVADIDRYDTENSPF